MLNVWEPTCAGSDLLIVVPSPSWPEEFKPHVQIVLLFAIAILCEAPAFAMYHGFWFCVVETALYADLFNVVPSPNWPEELKPQAYNVPFNIPTVWLPVEDASAKDQDEYSANS